MESYVHSQRLRLQSLLNQLLQGIMKASRKIYWKFRADGVIRRNKYFQLVTDKNDYCDDVLQHAYGQAFAERNLVSEWRTGFFWFQIMPESDRFHDKTGKRSVYMVFTNVSDQRFTRDFDISKHESSLGFVDSYYPRCQGQPRASSARIPRNHYA